MTAQKKMDEVQVCLTQFLKPLGFRKSSRNYNRTEEDGVVQVVNLQTGMYELGSPLPPSVQHWRPNLYGKFTVNLGVWVSDIEHAEPKGPWPKFIIEARCSIRTRLSDLAGHNDLWWSLDEPKEKTLTEIISLLDTKGLLFLERFSTRDKIISEWVQFNDREMKLTNRSKLDVGIILATAGRQSEAVTIIEDHLQASSHKHHNSHVREVAEKLHLTLSA